MQTAVHAEGDLAPALEWQALSAVRVIWPGPFTGDLRHPTRLRQEHEPHHDLVAHAVATAGEVLVAYASVVASRITALGESWPVLGLSNVFVFPSHRGEGAGRAVVRAAMDWMRTRPEPLAVLFSVPGTEPFYARLGWSAATGETLIGPPDAPHPHPAPATRMVLPLAPRAEAALDALLAADAHVGPSRW